MYIPPEFAINDRNEILQLIREYSFGILITYSDSFNASHIPFIIADEDPLVLWGHLATGNDQLRGIGDSRALVIFSGPHSYISPSWYAVPGQVPTWDYITVHAEGHVRLTGRQETTKMLEKMVSYYESGSSLSGKLGESAYQDMMSGIVGFRLEVDRVWGKAKLSQNHSEDDRIGVVRHLSSSSNQDEVKVADLIRKTVQNL
ncbi:MAG: FMN-binding negative transcriptional regulator [Thermoplasmataceae archaeon]